MTNPELSHIKIEISFCLHKNTFSSARGWGDIRRKVQVTHLMDEGKVVDVVLLDFSKAFDPVPHSILLDLLSSCRINRFMVRCVKNWLKGRAQRVVVNGAISGW
ncbi:hypothetical protein QYF61_007771 [Mycteria americana]|uniref:Reverse transcriptase domain-containing protein n=1 Tax=Mycteria americana TaxID=33587 RepID=A0AAN7N425_MYCAM|nr:hypothetical protein QYF61_007771 [Mycteria americana]